MEYEKTSAKNGTESDEEERKRPPEVKKRAEPYSAGKPRNTDKKIPLHTDISYIIRRPHRSADGGYTTYGIQNTRAYLKIRFRAERRDFYGETGGGGRGISRYFEPEPKRYSQKSRSLRAGMEF
ncbi:MAG: hypothetical protein A3D67_04535 [Candidatus Lloydbacteria bacterium RIFCSPHIGHO2_02_FULL_51_22]|uniref:Uncharacterized protein n=1 Tax=Candidatus Lloydbacteria bacterium RIFCSPHIGHO2_02_FULL_51_22 TaxID=1798663 RepID=A0A1G2D7I5_9BACT|nr:MAG: hypothetical protein A3D67_04535 [Candidatus Lloydbacteria bacterium RIFCSPHIGHO2_02_FULL_51_22]